MPLLIEDGASEFTSDRWSGPCLCPDGTSYSVGATTLPTLAEPNRCSLACLKGISGQCVLDDPEGKPRRKVTCADAYEGHWYDALMNPPERLRHYYITQEGSDMAAQPPSDSRESRLGSASAWVIAGDVAASGAATLYLDLGLPMEVLGVVTQKRKDEPSQFVRTYKVYVRAMALCIYVLAFSAMCSLSRTRGSHYIHARSCIDLGRLT